MNTRYKIHTHSCLPSQLTACAGAASKLAAGTANVCTCTEWLLSLMPVWISFSALVKKVWINSQHSAYYSCLTAHPVFMGTYKAISIYILFWFLKMESFSCDIGVYFKAPPLSAFLPLFFFFPRFKLSVNLLVNAHVLLPHVHLMSISNFYI